MTKIVHTSESAAYDLALDLTMRGIRAFAIGVVAVSMAGHITCAPLRPGIKQFLGMKVTPFTPSSSCPAKYFVPSRTPQ